jgi:hypothetical protein
MLSVNVCFMLNVVCRPQERKKLDGVSKQGAEQKIFRYKRETETESRSNNNEIILNLYCSPNAISLMKPSIIKWAGNVARSGEIKCIHNLCWIGKPKCRIILKIHSISRV